MNGHTKQLWMIGLVVLCAAALSACASPTPAATEPPPATAAPTEAAAAPTAAPAATQAATEVPTQAATEAATATEAVTQASAPETVVVNVATDPKMGKILVDAKGLTLYLYTKDTPGKSVCNDKCATFWPPLYIAQDGKVTADSSITGTFSAIQRDDGTFMVAYNGVALYYYQKDAKPGDILGEGVQNNTWHVVHP